MADKLLGSFVWCELMTTDLAGAESFYKNVVGWTAVPFAPDGSYIVFNNPSGVGSAGMMTLPDAARQMGTPPHWLMYVGTPSVDDTALRIAQLGGKVLKQPEDIPSAGRFAVVQDPFGAAFGIYSPPANRPGKGPAGVGDFSWFELYTPNPDGAWKFYNTLFGWEKTSAMDMGEMGVYQMFGRGGGIPNGGIMKPPPGAPAAWAPYVMVKDAKAAAGAATANGGKIVNGPMEVPGGDWIAQGFDPQGAMFSVHSLNPATQKALATTSTATKASPAKKAAPAKKKKTATKKAKVKAVKKAAPKAKAKAARKPSTPVKKKTAKQKPARRTASNKVAKKAAKRKK
ncbi:MAG TPA: VOC family protein [Vicinamibacterales bacterium]|nr:VOC family protein [Vicinamibacterales bacterium]